MKKLGFSLIILLFSSFNVFAQDFGSKIIGGQEADEGEYPWAVALVQSSISSAFDGQFCGGSLIGNQWVLTAAHCVDGSAPEDIDLVIGRLDLRTTDGERIEASQIIIHPDYDPETSDSDIALIKLSGTTTQGTINIPTEETGDAISTGVNLTAVGWGTTAHSGGVSSDPSPLLLEVVLPVFDQDSCQEVYGIITENMVCAGLTAGGKDTCQGDSGGPLVKKIEGKFFLIGATSFGFGCALPGFPGVYTKVSKFVSFIEDNTGIGPEEGDDGGGGPGGGDDGDDGDGDDEEVGPIEPPNCFPTDGSFPTLDDSNDFDGDGSDNSAEVINGTNPSDPGSFAQKLESPTFALWTGFLGITPIAELINRGDQTGAVMITLYNENGTVAGVSNRAVPAGSQVDVIISDMDGFAADSHGLLKIDFCDMKLDGRISYYRAGSNGDFDFAYSIPFTAPLYGNSSVGFNTFQPSLNPSEANNLVANWLTIVNLSSNAGVFTVNKYDASGNSLSTQTVALSAGERRDVEAGHVNPGPSNVGFIEIIPVDASSAYQAVLIRYGSNDEAGAGTDGYSFAFPLLAQAGNGQTSYAPLTTTVNSQNWLEVINTSDQVVTAAVNFYLSNSTSGELVDTQNIALAPRSQIHFSVNEKLGNAKLGYVEVNPVATNSIISQSMVYTYDEASSSIVSMYGSQTREALGDELYGSYNLYLNMFNYLKLINVSSSGVVVTIRVDNGSSAFSALRFVPANGSLDLPIHSGIQFKTSPNTFGTLKITPATSGTIISELLRIRPQTGNDGAIDFIFPTSVRFTDSSSCCSGDPRCRCVM